MKFEYAEQHDWEGIVTPLAGVWVEIRIGAMGKREGQRSLPLRECGLKFEYAEQHDWEGIVTPLAGVWVEIIRSLCP